MGEEVADGGEDIGAEWFHEGRDNAGHSDVAHSDVDENLSPKLPRLLAVIFPDRVHASECGLLGFSDENVWAYARDHGFTMISKDSDFQQRSLP